MMHFQNPLFLLLLIPILIALYRSGVSRNQTGRVQYSVNIPKEFRKKNPLHYLLLIKTLGIISLVIALARPQSSTTHTNREVNGIDIMLVMDVSASMNIEDLSDESRLLVAKRTMKQFIEGRKDDRIGFVIFSGEPFTMAPPTLDYNLVINAIDETEVGKLKDGTAIGDGLSLAVSRLKRSKAKSKVVILLTDGDNNVGQIDPMTAGDLAAGFGIRVYTIAIGKEGRVRLPIKHKTAFGQDVVSYQWFDNALNPALLKKISDLTFGKFFRVTELEGLSEVFKEIDHLEKSKIKISENVKYKDLFPFYLNLGMLFIALEKLFAFGLWRIFP